MAMYRLCSSLCAALLLAFAVTVTAQQTNPSNNSADIPPYDASPRFWVNGTGFDHFEVVPLGWYARISQQSFRNIQIDGRLVLVGASNANNALQDGIIYMSCDPQAYTGNLGPTDVLQMVASSQPGNAIILYSTYADHCDASNLNLLTAANGVFTTLNSTLAADVVREIQGNSNGMPAIVTPDLNSYHNPPNMTGYSGGGNGSPGPTTAVAMIILYTITGLITALFIVIIVTGAVRAHRHPERYGPRNIVGRPRRSRAKGIARAMLDTIPIVKFGEKEDTVKKEPGDIEMAATTSTTAETDKAKTADVSETESTTTPNADGTDESGQLGCSICTEDFNKGEEVRVLPCNHKFHPECVDPWLLNVSGTCPLCRVDLRPPEEQNEDETAGTTVDGTADSTTAAAAAPPLGGRRGSNAGRRDTMAFANLRSVAHASREDRIAALRRFRQQRRRQAEQTGTADQPDEEGRGVTRRLRERFRVRTRRQGEETVEEAARS